MADAMENKVPVTICSNVGLLPGSKVQPDWQSREVHRRRWFTDLLDSTVRRDLNALQGRRGNIHRGMKRDRPGETSVRLVTPSVAEQIVGQWGQRFRWEVFIEIQFQSREQYEWEDKAWRTYPYLLFTFLRERFHSLKPEAFAQMAKRVAKIPSTEPNYARMIDILNVIAAVERGDKEAPPPYHPLGKHVDVLMPSGSGARVWWLPPFREAVGEAELEVQVRQRSNFKTFYSAREDLVSRRRLTRHNFARVINYGQIANSHWHWLEMLFRIFESWRFPAKLVPLMLLFVEARLRELFDSEAEHQMFIELRSAVEAIGVQTPNLAKVAPLINCFSQLSVELEKREWTGPELKRKSLTALDASAASSAANVVADDLAAARNEVVDAEDSVGQAKALETLVYGWLASVRVNAELAELDEETLAEQVQRDVQRITDGFPNIWEILLAEVDRIEAPGGARLAEIVRKIRM